MVHVATVRVASGILVLVDLALWWTCGAFVQRKWHACIVGNRRGFIVGNRRVFIVGNRRYSVPM